MCVYESLYSYQSPTAAMVEQCLPMTTGRTESYVAGWIPMMVTNEECRVWMVDGQSEIVPPLPLLPKPQPTISTVDLLRLVAQGRARFINTPVAPAKPAEPTSAQTCAKPATNGPCCLETCTGRCGLPLHTPSNVMLAKAVRTGHILWGDLD